MTRLMRLLPREYGMDYSAMLLLNWTNCVLLNNYGVLIINYDKQSGDDAFALKIMFWDFSPPYTENGLIKQQINILFCTQFCFCSLETYISVKFSCLQCLDLQCQIWILFIFHKPKGPLNSMWIYINKYIKIWNYVTSKQTKSVTKKKKNPILASSKQPAFTLTL